MTIKLQVLEPNQENIPYLQTRSLMLEKKGCDSHYLTCDNSIHWPLTSEGGWAGRSACGQVGGWVSLLDRLDERLGGRMVVGGGWWVKLGGWLKVMGGG